MSSTLPPAVSALLALYLDYRGLTCGPRALRLYQHILTRFLCWQADRPLTSGTLISYLLTYRAKAGDTQLNVYRVLKSYCRWLTARGDLPGDLFSGPLAVPRPKTPRVRRRTYTRADIVAMLSACHLRCGSRPRWAADGPRVREAAQARALVLLLIDSALRADEVTRLSCGQVRTPELIVRGKGGHEDRVFVTESTAAVLRALAGDRPDDAPLFRDWHGRRCTIRAIHGLLTRLAARAGVELPPRPTHALRHYAAQTWARAGLPDLVIMRLMRHRSVAVTSLYTAGARDEDIAALHQRVSPVAGFVEEADH